MRHYIVLNPNQGSPHMLLLVLQIVSIAVIRDETATQKRNPAALIFNCVPINLVKKLGQNEQKSEKKMQSGPGDGQYSRYNNFKLFIRHIKPVAILTIVEQSREDSK